MTAPPLSFVIHENVAANFAAYVELTEYERRSFLKSVYLSSRQQAGELLDCLIERLELDEPEIKVLFHDFESFIPAAGDPDLSFVPYLKKHESLIARNLLRSVDGRVLGTTMRVLDLVRLGLDELVDAYSHSIPMLGLQSKKDYEVLLKVAPAHVLNRMVSSLDQRGERQCTRDLVHFVVAVLLARPDAEVSVEDVLAAKFQLKDVSMISSHSLGAKALMSTAIYCDSIKLKYDTARLHHLAPLFLFNPHQRNPGEYFVGMHKDLQQIGKPLPKVIMYSVICTRVRNAMGNALCYLKVFESVQKVDLRLLDKHLPENFNAYWTSSLEKSQDIRLANSVHDLYCIATAMDSGMPFPVEALANAVIEHAKRSTDYGLREVTDEEMCQNKAQVMTLLCLAPSKADGVRLAIAAQIPLKFFEYYFHATKGFREQDIEHLKPQLMTLNYDASVASVEQDDIFLLEMLIKAAEQGAPIQPALIQRIIANSTGSWRADARQQFFQRAPAWLMEASELVRTERLAIDLGL
jgi:hypothetical protein